MNTNSYFTVELLTAGTLGLQQPSGTGTPVTVYYWINKDPNVARDNYDGSITTSSTVQYISNLNQGDKVKFYRAETTEFSGPEASGSWNNRFTGTAYTKIYGNIASLIGFNETIPQNCFRYMFYNWRVQDASELDLPWDTLSNYCYARMFQQCQSLTKGPKLKAQNLATACYQWMFYNCSSISEVICLAKTPSGTNNWFYNQPATGTFIKHPDATWVNSNSGIPAGWTVKNMNQYTQSIDFNRMASAFSRGNISLSAIYGRGNVLLWGTPVNDYASKYFTVKILTSSSGRLYYRCNSGYEWTVEYSKNNGNWISLTANESYGIGISNYISVSVGDEIRFRKTGTSSSTVAYSYLWSNTCTFEAYGNIMSLAYGDNFIGQTTIPGNYYFNRFCSTLNYGETNTWIKSVENLVLPATTLTSHCYDAMFAECTQITKAPVLPATTLVSHCYDAMFGGCTSLQYIKAMFTTTPGSNYTDYWVVNVPSGGTFVKNSAATWNVTGSNGVPSGWTIEYA